MRYFLELSYNGKQYHGWQIQPNAPSVQQTLQGALSTLLRVPIEVVGAGRTDTGVHARYYVAHFDIPVALEERDKFIYHLNALLPHDIAVHQIRPVRDDAHARFDAILREYQYFISQHKDPFMRDFAYQFTLPLDMLAMDKAIKILLRTEDFTSFSKLHSNNNTNICHVSYAMWEEVDDMLVFTIAADRFLWNMVRAVVGTLIEVGRGKLTVKEFERIVQAQDRALAGTSAPPQGLFLTNIQYAEDVYI